MASLWRGGGRDKDVEKKEGGSEKTEGASLCLGGIGQTKQPLGAAGPDSLQRVAGSFVWKSSFSLINLEDRLPERDCAGVGDMISGNTHNGRRRRRK